MYNKLKLYIACITATATEQATPIHTTQTITLCFNFIKSINFFRYSLFTTAKIVDINTNQELSYNEEGEVRISGPNVMLGYHNNKIEEEKILHTDSKGVRWIYSGDLGYFDEDGHLYVKGRYKEMIVRPDGFKVYPTSIEDVILLHKDVSECKVVGCRDYTESQGELPKAFIRIKETEKDKEKIIEEIKNICERELAEYSLPFDYEIVEKFPVTSIGKINTTALKKETEEKLKKQTQFKIKTLKK